MGVAHDERARRWASQVQRSSDFELKVFVSRMEMQQIDTTTILKNTVLIQEGIESQVLFLKSEIEEAARLRSSIPFVRIIT